MNESQHAGKSTRAMAARRRKTAIAIVICALVIMVIITLLLERKVLAGIGGTTLGLLLLMRIVADLADRETGRRLKAERRALRGAKAEEAVGAILSGLGQGFYPIHDVESPYGNIDHIVVTRTGAVCLLETKAHRGRVELKGGSLLINGRNPERDFILQALRNATWLSELLSGLVGSRVWITPIIVFSNAFVPRLQAPKGVSIVNKKYLASELRAVCFRSSAGGRPWELRNQIAEVLRQGKRLRNRNPNSA
jgi:hypothetical protein